MRRLLGLNAILLSDRIARYGMQFGVDWEDGESISRLTMVGMVPFRWSGTFEAELGRGLDHLKREMEREGVATLVARYEHSQDAAQSPDSSSVTWT